MDPTSSGTSDSVPAPSSSSNLHAAYASVAEKKVCWSSLFHTGSSAQLSYHQPLMAKGKNSVFIAKSVHNSGIAAWEDYLVGQFLGSMPFLSLIQPVVHQIWGRRYRVDVFLLDNGLVLFKFENPQTCSWILEGGPWFIAQCPLFLKK